VLAAAVLASLTALPAGAASDSRGGSAVSPLATTAASVPGEVLAWGCGGGDPNACIVPAGAMSGVSAIAAGEYHSLAVKSDGSVLAWGCTAASGTDFGQCADLEAGSGVIAVAAGDNHSLGLKEDRSVLAWGCDNGTSGGNFGQCQVPAGAASDVIAIAAAWFHNLALKEDGSVFAWGCGVGGTAPGTFNYGQCDVPAGAMSDVIAIAAGDYHSLALKRDGSVLAWGCGDQDVGQCADLEAGSGVIAIAAGEYHSLALKSDGSVLAWGCGSLTIDFGQCDVPDALSGVTAIAGSNYHSLALKSDGSVLAWGCTGATVGTCDVPSEAASGVVAIAASDYQSLAIKAPLALTIDDVSIAEGNAGTTDFAFTVSLSGPAPAGGVTFDIATADNTATAPSDYASSSLTNQTIPAGSTSYTFHVSVNGDTTVESNETFFVNVTNVTGATLSDGQGLGTIQDDDAAFVLAINDVSLAEGNGPGTAEFAFTVSLAPASGQQVTVDYATQNDTASGGATCPGPDYESQSDTLTFAPGETEKTITVEVCGDTTVEDNETFLVNLSNPTNAAIADAQGLGTIQNDDQPALSIDDVTQAEGNAGTTDFAFTVSLSAPAPTGGVSFDIQTANDSATAPSDYSASSLTAQTIAAGSTSYTFHVSVNGDTTVEPTETFFVNVSNVTGATLADGQGQGTIQDDDQPVISGGVLAWGCSGAADFGQCTVPAEASSGVTAIAANERHSLAMKSDGRVLAWGCTGGGNDYGQCTVPAAASTGVTAIAAGNYHSLALKSNGVLAWGCDGPDFGQCTVPAAALNGVTAIAAGAYHSLALKNNAVIAWGCGGGGDPAQCAVPAAASSGVTAIAANARHSLALKNNGVIAWGCTGGDSTPCDVPAGAMSDVVAIAAGVYHSLALKSDGSVLAWGCFVDTGQCTVPVQGVSAISAGTFHSLALKSNGVLAWGCAGNNYGQCNVPAEAASGVVAIAADTYHSLAIDTSLALALSIDDVQHAEGNTGTTAFTFTVSLSGPAPTGGVSFDIQTADNTATAPGDYTARSLTGQTIPAGTSSTTFTVQANGDTTVEPTESFFVNVSNLSNATLGDGQGIGTIQNDDQPQPALSIDDVQHAEGNAGTTDFTFTVSLSAPAPAGGVGFDIATADDTAAAPGDYTARSLTGQSIPAGGTSATFTVVVNGDTTVEPDETFFVNLSNPTNASISDDQGLGTIQNDDQPALSIDDVTQAEGDTGTTNFTFTVTLTPASPGPVSVNYATAHDTTDASDYTAIAATLLTFAAGETSKQVTVQVNGDTAVEPDERFFVNLSSPSGATISDNQGLGTIQNDDPTLVPADVQITKTVSDATPALGDDFVYRITVTNLGPGVARDVVVTDDLSGDLYAIGLVAAAPTECDPFSGSGADVNCRLGDLPAAPAPGSAQTIDLRVDARFKCDLIGTSGDDSDASIGSTSGPDVICGGGGNDTFSGGGGDDELYGFANTLTLQELPATIANIARVTTATSDPAPANNSASRSVSVSAGTDGRDTISGNTGDDLLGGGPGGDTLNGGDGRDSLTGGDGNDTLNGGDDADAAAGNDGNDDINGGQGDDSFLRGLTGGPGRDTISGGAGNDELEGGADDDVMSGGGGNDTMHGDADTPGEPSGGPNAGNDRMDGNAGDDTMHGQDGQDRLNGGSGNDRLDGGTDKDFLDGGADADVLDCGTGTDTYVLGPGDTFANCEIRRP
jgi:uncharacterized repeat protein (TIGR01451 family)